MRVTKTEKAELHARRQASARKAWATIIATYSKRKVANIRKRAAKAIKARALKAKRSTRLAVAH
jgi:hypothetical protein